MGGSLRIKCECGGVCMAWGRRIWWAMYRGSGGVSAVRVGVWGIGCELCGKNWCSAFFASVREMLWKGLGS